MPSAVEKKLSNEMAEEVRYPIMIPIMSSIRLLFTKDEKKSSMTNIRLEPANAPMMMAINPVKLFSPAAPITPPKQSITKATPKLAPVSMPKIEGPANGLLNEVCNKSPLTARAAPASKAVTVCGTRDSHTI